tara:strand:- start:990 stop:1232 length:243 start_codon:yes stop_codon:yes gene_type:complete
METLIAILVAIIGGLGFMLSRKSKENENLKADKSLTDQKQSSKVVDKKNRDLQEEIELLEDGKNKSVEDGFWKDYTKGKK